MTRPHRTSDLWNTIANHLDNLATRITQLRDHARRLARLTR